MRLINLAIQFGLFILAVYLAATAYVGYQVGHGIFLAKSSNALVAIGANLAGREFVEQQAILAAKLPDYVTDSPSFWWALRITE
jgi:hypothetical protein